MSRAFLAVMAVVVVTAWIAGCGASKDVAIPATSDRADANYVAELTEMEAMSAMDGDSAAPSGGAQRGGAQRRADVQATLRSTPATSSAAPHPSPAAQPIADGSPAVLATPALGVEFKQAHAEPPADRFGETDSRRWSGQDGDRFDQIVESGFVTVDDAPLSTFSIDVDTASYAKTRMYLQQHNELPPPDAVRIEELVNYFDYDYSPPAGDDPFAVHMEVARAPWQPEHLLARIGIKGRTPQDRPTGNLVFLIDISGSMNQPNKIGLVKHGLQLLTSQLNDEDRVSIVVYAGAAGLVLPPTHGDNRHVILDAVERLSAGGSTNGGEGIRLAYRVARENFVKGGVNRVLLCTDGDFNVGTTNTGDLVRLAAEHARQGVFLSVLGFGMGNHNDAMLEELSNKANGNYAFIDSDREARKVLLDQLDSTLVTIAKDVKIQIEFNPLHVASYRLIGYENRRLADRDFNDDKKDAGEIGAGHTVTALYELVLADGAEGQPDPQVDPLKYQKARQLADAADSDDLLNLKLRFKRPAQDRSELAVFPVKNIPVEFSRATKDFQFAAAVAEFGMLLRNSQHRGDASYAEVLEIAGASCGRDEHGYRTEFLQVVTTARRLVEPEAASTFRNVPEVRSEFPAQYVSPPQYVYLPASPSKRSLSAGVVFALAVAMAWVIMAVIGVVIVVWAILARPERRGWAADKKALS